MKTLLGLTARGLAAAAALTLAGLAFSAAANPAVALSTQYNDRSFYVFFAAGDPSVVLDGATRDYRNASAVRRGTEALLYFRHRGSAYVIRDVDTLRRAEAILRPQLLIHAQRDELGGRQGQLGGQQSVLDNAQSRLAMLLENATAAQRAEINRQMADLSRRQSEVATRSAEFARQQDALAREEQRLRRIGDANLRGLIGEILQGGLAQRVG